MEKSRNRCSLLVTCLSNASTHAVTHAVTDSSPDLATHAVTNSSSDIAANFASNSNSNSGADSVANTNADTADNDSSVDKYKDDGSHDDRHNSDFNICLHKEHYVYDGAGGNRAETQEW